MSNNQSASADTKSGVMHLRPLTSLRFIGASIVFATHLHMQLFPAELQIPIGGPLLSFFFVLSGFILTWVYTGRLNRQTLAEFCVTRWARIWPLHFCCLILFLVLVRGVSGSGFATNGPANLLANLTLTHSWIPYSSWYIGFNSVSWSISTEMALYMLFPFLLPGAIRLFSVKVVVAGLVALAVVSLTQFALNAGRLPAWLLPSYIAVACPLTRLLEFVMGIATCKWMLARHGRTLAENTSRQVIRDTLLELAVLGLLCLFWYLVWKNRWPAAIRRAPWGGVTFGIWFGMAGGAPLFAWLVYVFARSRGMLSRIASYPLLVWLGDISFSFYLIHQIVLRTMEDMYIPVWQFVLLSFGISLFSAALLYRIVEMPTRNAAVLFYRGEPARARQKWLAGIRSTLTSSQGIFQIAALIALIIVTASIEDPQAEQRLIDSIVAGTPEALRNIEFEGEAVLLGFRVQKGGGGLLVQMAWRSLPGRQRMRVLHVCDSTGDLRGQAPGEREAFSRAANGQAFLESTVVRNRQYKSGSTLALGFWSAATGFAPVHSGSDSELLEYVDADNRVHFAEIDPLR